LTANVKARYRMANIGDGRKYGAPVFDRLTPD